MKSIVKMLSNGEESKAVKEEITINLTSLIFFFSAVVCFLMQKANVCFLPISVLLIIVASSFLVKLAVFKNNIVKEQKVTIQ